jgi:Na+/H+ antiporter NhaD/arsenite permease-like protein
VDRYRYLRAMLATRNTEILGLAWAIPFAGLLLTIALAPLALPRFWHRHYGKLAAIWSLAFLAPDVARQGGRDALQSLIAVALHEYLPFVLLLGALFAIAGGLHVKGTPRASPGVNVTLLALGTLMASVIGTTGASMVILRPLIRANRHRQRSTHVFVFFILLVANVGGGLTPLGDPPLFLGYLLGVPFFWPLIHLGLPTLLLAVILMTTFYALDTLVHRRSHGDPEVRAEIEKLGLDGRINLLLLAAVVIVVLMRAAWHPDLGLDLLGVGWNLADLAADVILFALGALSLALTRPLVRRANAFSWAPMVEVAILFAAIFVTLIPVSAIIAAGNDGPAGPLVARLFAAGMPVDHAFYWGTGALSALLDNAPTYLVFVDFAGGNVAQLTQAWARTLAAISAGAVFFGGMTYVGNAPNFMVKAIVESQGLRMPSFFGYVGWATLCLLPWLVVVDWLFFR